MVDLSRIAYATETEMVTLRGRVADLEKAVGALVEHKEQVEKVVEELREQNEQLRRRIAALHDGAWLRQQ